MTSRNDAISRYLEHEGHSVETHEIISDFHFVAPIDIVRRVMRNRDIDDSRLNDLTDTRHVARTEINGIDCVYLRHKTSHYDWYGLSRPLDAYAINQEWQIDSQKMVATSKVWKKNRIDKDSHKVDSQGASTARQDDLIDSQNGAYVPNWDIVIDALDLYYDNKEMWDSLIDIYREYDLNPSEKQNETIKAYVRGEDPNPDPKIRRRLERIGFIEDLGHPDSEPKKITP